MPSFYNVQFDFFSSQLPDGLESLGIYLCSLILAVVMTITTNDGSPGWVPPNPNKGHLERFLFLMAAFTAVELMVYILVLRRYKCVVMECREEDFCEV